MVVISIIGNAVLLSQQVDTLGRQIDHVKEQVTAYNVRTITDSSLVTHKVDGLDMKVDNLDVNIRDIKNQVTESSVETKANMTRHNQNAQESRRELRTLNDRLYRQDAYDLTLANKLLVAYSNTTKK